MIARQNSGRRFDFDRGRHDWALWPSEGAAINEKARGPDHRSVALALNDLAELYKEEGRYGHADPLWPTIPQIPLATTKLIE